MAKTSLSGACELCADSGRKSEAHRTESTGIQPQPRMIEPQELRCPHLVLADIGGYNCLARRETVDFDHQVLRFDFGVRKFRRDRMFLFPCLDLAVPVLPLLRVLRLLRRSQVDQHAVDPAEHSFAVADDGQVRRPVLSDLCGIDIEVDHFGVRRKG